jgi:hypothetical protein
MPTVKRDRAWQAMATLGAKALGLLPVVIANSWLDCRQTRNRAGFAVGSAIRISARLDRSDD